MFFDCRIGGGILWLRLHVTQFFLQSDFDLIKIEGRRRVGGGWLGRRFDLFIFAVSEVAAINFGEYSYTHDGIVLFNFIFAFQHKIIH